MEPVDDPGPTTAQRYRTFAEIEAATSATYAEWAMGVAGDSLLIELIDELPVPKRQVNLVFAAARAAGAAVGGYPEFREWMLDHWPAVRRIARARSTQTNEAARCAVILPLLAALPQPIALIEVGASAGLCLYPDRYSYRYGDRELHPVDGPSEVLLAPKVTGNVPVPDRMPTITWRAGIDINPLDVNDPDDMAWLEALVWPEHDERRRRLSSAISLAQQDPPRIVRSDAVAGVRALADEAPEDATLVIFHSAVLAYFSTEERETFARLMAELPGHWISNEGQSITPLVQERLSRQPRDPSLFVVALDGNPVAFAGGHGQSLEWID
ncbi:DUF2332 domain-containing protein [Salinibacterium sp. G-O1]|uniref:DUF2332 domain-containing protein n=1 Tax=Salinibacterium sp. G-O1 TaxID=3046208 RepID=UPI0024BBC98C|nr:DUF2332 domain-containing protein [Salinibacterium sp. G-O1]MDJ0335539.1 DUF2332 domain-containing protein [Salinibacterium sp. G-O1]